MNIPSRTAPSYGEPGADKLVNTVLLAGGLATSTSEANLLPGDVVGWEWGNDTTLDHDTLYVGNGQLAAHSNSTLDVPVSYYNGKAFYTHITDSVVTRYISVSSVNGNLAFGNVNVGSSSTPPLTFTIVNGGNAPLAVSSISYPAGFTGDWSSGTIPPDSAQTVSVTFSPTAGGSYGGTVTVNTSNEIGTNTIAISGTGVMTATTAAVVSSGGTPFYGSKVTFTATVTPASGSGETGTVQFQIDGNNAGSPVSLSGNTATYATTALGAGTHSIVAIYSGDGKFSSSTSNTISQTVHKATLTITASNNSKTYGTQSSFASTAFTPSGLVTANGDSVTGVSENSTAQRPRLRWAAMRLCLVPRPERG